MYSPTVLDHFANPRNAGDLPDADVTVERTNPVCGDLLQLQLKVTDGRIAAVRFKVKGCTATIACASMLTELVTGKSAQEARMLQWEMIVTALGGLPQASLHASHLAVETLRAALDGLKK